MHTDHLKLFLTIARFRSLSRAAIELDLGAATVSERLKALEQLVGTPLFERQGRGVTLTPAGAAFLPHAERALEVLRQAQASAQAAVAGQRGQVTVAVTVTSGAYLFAPALVAFQQSHPNVEVRVRSAHSWDAPGLVLDGVVELALISGPNTHPALEALGMFRSPLVLVTGRAHPLARQPQVTPLELAQAQMLVSYWGPASQHFLEGLRAQATGAMWMELSPVELVKGMLLAGTGVSLLPALAVQRELAAGELVALTLTEATSMPHWDITLIRLKKHLPNPVAEALTQTLRERLPKLPQVTAHL